MAKYIMALDAGTTSNRCILLRRRAAKCAALRSANFPSIFRSPAGSSTMRTRSGRRSWALRSRRCSKIGATAADIAAIGITNQRETAIVWDKATGEPIHHAIVWQCRRTSGLLRRAQGARA